MKTKRPNFISRGSFFLVLVSCVSVTLRVIAGNDTNECWISARTNALGFGQISGNGAITNPFYGDFDAIVQSVPTNTTIHLLPGIHFTKGYASQPGDKELTAYQRVIGAGIDTTTVRRDTNFNYDVAQMLGLFYSHADGVEVRDVTLDVNANGTERWEQNAVGLNGNYSKISRVRAINTSGNASTGEECFAVRVSGIRSIISRVEVSSVKGSYCTAVTLFPSAGAIAEHCRVVFPVVTSIGSAFQGYQANGTYNALFRGNVSEGGTTGFYTDTFSETNLTIINNAFRNAWNGVLISKSTSAGYNFDGAAIQNNVIEISTNIPTSQGEVGYGVLVTNEDISGTVYERNVAITGNTIRVFNNGATPPGTVAISAASNIRTNLQGVRILDNTIDRSFGFLFNAQSVWLASNMGLDGAPLHYREVAAGSPGTVALNSIDGSVIVTSTATTNLILPTAVGFTGREILLSNRKGGGSVTVNPAPGETIAPSGSFAISSGTVTVKLISDGISIWIRETGNTLR